MHHKTIFRGVAQRGIQLLLTVCGERAHVELPGLGYDVLPDKKKNRNTQRATKDLESQPGKLGIIWKYIKLTQPVAECS